MIAIVYTSHTGSAKTYAEMAGMKFGLPVYSLAEARSALREGEEIVYFGWMMAGNIQGWKDAQKRYRPAAVCAVGMSSSETLADGIRRQNKLDAALPLFLLQGAYDKTKLRGMYRFAMKIVGSMLDRQISQKQEKTEEEVLILKMLREGGSGIREENLSGLYQWMQCRQDGDV